VLSLSDPTFLGVAVAAHPTPITPSAPPGVPFADFNAQGLSPGDVTTWANDGSDATGDVTTFGSANAPECITAGAGSPVPGAKYVRFDLANTEGLQGALTTSRNGDNVFAAVVRWNGAATADYQVVVDGDDVTNRNAIARGTSGTGRDWVLYAGTQVGSGATTEVDKWVRVVGRVGSNGLLSVERAARVVGGVGANNLDGITLGAKYDGTQWANMDLARLVMWEDGTTVLQAQQWLEENYDFTAVPPGNPRHFWMPEHYSVGPVATLTDLGSFGENLICTDVNIAIDPESGSRSFVFNGISSRAIDVGYASDTAQPVLFGTMVRSNEDNTTEYFISISPSEANSPRMWLTNANKINISAGGGTIGGIDLDTMAPKGTRRRWLSTVGLYSGISSQIWTDGETLGVGDAGTEGLRSFMLGARYTTGYGSWFGGAMGPVMVYQGSVEATATRGVEVNAWLQAWYPEAFAAAFQASPIGAPFADYNAQLVDLGDVTTWTNDGSDATGDVTTFGSANAPECITAGAGSPVPGVKYVTFDLANTEALQGALTTTRTGEVVFAAVMRFTAVNPDQYLFDGDDVTNRMAVIANTSLGWATYAGTRVNSGARPEVGKWVRVVGRLGTSSGLLSVERATRCAGDSGTGNLDGITIGARYSGTDFADMDLARLVMWEDGTTVLEAERWLEETYAFAAVPPGNPVHWWDPNDYAVGALSGAGSVVDKGAGGENLTPTDLTIIDDTDAPGVNVFSFNGTTSKMIDDGAFSIASDDLIFAACVRPTTISVTRTLFGQSEYSTTTLSCYLSATNTIRRNLGSNVGGENINILAPFNTSTRWLNLSFLAVSASGNGACYVDGSQSGVGSEGDQNPDGLCIGAQYTAGYLNYFTGRMSDVLIYAGADEANAARAAEVEQWLQRHRRLATIPGVPFGDFDAESLSLTDADPVSTWANNGSENDATQTGTARPTFYAAGGPEGGKRVHHDPSIPQNMLTPDGEVLETQPGAMLAVMRLEDFTTQCAPLGSDLGGSLWTTWVSAGGANIGANAGATLNHATTVPQNEWLWIATEFGHTTDGHIEPSWESGTTGSTGTGSENFADRITVGSSQGEASPMRGDLGRVIIWGDGTPWEQVVEYARRRYPGVDPY